MREVYIHSIMVGIDKLPPPKVYELYSEETGRITYYEFLSDKLITTPEITEVWDAGLGSVMVVKVESINSDEAKRIVEQAVNSADKKWITMQNSEEWEIA